MSKRVFFSVMLLSIFFSGIHAQNSVLRSDTVRSETYDSLTQAQPMDDKYHIVTNRFGTTGLSWGI